MPDIVIYSSGFCPYCSWAKKMLDGRQASYSEIRIDQVEGAQQEMLSKSEGQMTVPQIFIGSFHVGGYTDMVKLDQQGQLDPLLQESN
ncbi:MAG: glutaredoxin 3 [Gammaproteobacteria bacterium]|jgi:glutaredoxin 3|nr:glutaredoxin 3 [Gammaproteobacteria bacterium]MBT4078316.1 glutaredoxin 3 [Gammaproteobacteria bacterium]MBT4194249.1 glutaredoxin 3 [Gammaproteobacteria bacterium]MBT4451619.1 glutaredoxin 3 [Gammaproteobacteria bacterium]MBT4861931.1 glutaredoxin 3 [Gammaproteobacteria bacterium]